MLSLNVFRVYPLVQAAWACRRVEQQWPFGCLPVAVLTASAPSAAALCFPFFQTNNFQINGRNYLWPPQLRTTAIKLINRGRLSVSPDCCVIRGAINKAVLLPCDILQMVWQSCGCQGSIAACSHTHGSVSLRPSSHTQHVEAQPQLLLRSACFCLNKEEFPKWAELSDC